jgi:ribosomal protein S18 acetylase RimI-like enzyme
LTHDFTIRALRRDDLADVRFVLDTSGLFPSDMLGEMAEPFLSGETQCSWLVALREGRTIAFAYCEPERMTEGTYNLLAIAVGSDRQRTGAGAALVRHLEADLRQGGARLLLVETSTDPDQEGARAFYAKEGFTEEARIRDFYAPGQAKVVFWKQL